MNRISSTALLLGLIVCVAGHSQQCEGIPKFPSGIGGSALGSSLPLNPPSCQSDNGSQDSSKYRGPIKFYIIGRGSWDPNLIVSPKGFETPKWVSGKDNLGITIYFENDPNLATAPVHNAFIYCPLNAKQDPASFRLGNFGFNGMVFNVPPGLNTYHQRLDLRDSLGLYVDITAGINIVTNTAFWIFQSIDPLTNQAPVDPLTGFLPVKDSSSKGVSDTAAIKGDGFVNFTITPAVTAKTGDTIYAQAKIVFDVNDTIPTNTDFNTVDAVGPSSKINLATVSGNNISLFWSAADDPGGSGIKDYLLYVSKDGAPFVFHQQFTGLTTDFEGAPGSTYCFYTLARDNVNNLEVTLKNICEVKVNLTSTALPLTWLYFRGRQKAEDVQLNWATSMEINTDYFIVELSLDGQRFSEIGRVNAVGNSTQSNNYVFTDQQAIVLNTGKLYYRLRQVDKDGKYSYSNIVTVIITSQANLVVKVYPNPFGKSFSLSISTSKRPAAGDFVELYSLSGKLLYKQSLASRQNNVPVILNKLPVLASGTYIVHTHLNGEDNSIKVVKQ